MHVTCNVLSRKTVFELEETLDVIIFAHASVTFASETLTSNLENIASEATSLLDLEVVDLVNTNLLINQKSFNEEDVRVPNRNYSQCRQ